ncbi:hypothetical protein [Rubrivirga sp.]|uniref:hypothetical protein n=1 Tax=Rubrivirga sp. TaxID=1885344 RepID=UPI003C777D15
MRTSTLLIATLALAASAPSAQTGNALVSAEADAVHSFEIRDGQIYLDGRHLPDAVPPGLDLAGYDGELTFSGPVAPLLEIDGAPFVLEADRLTPLSISSRAGNPVYIVDEATSTDALPREQMQPIIEAAYMRDVADSDRTLYDQMRREADLEAEVTSLANQLRDLPDGDERSGLHDELRRQLSDLLSLKHQIRAQEFDLAGRRLEAARQDLERRRSLHDAIVDHRLHELVGER